MYLPIPLPPGCLADQRPLLRCLSHPTVIASQRPEPSEGARSNLALEPTLPVGGRLLRAALSQWHTLHCHCEPASWTQWRSAKQSRTWTHSAGWRAIASGCALAM